MCTYRRVVNSGLQPAESDRGIQSHSRHIARMKVLASEEASLNNGIIQIHCKRVPVSWGLDVCLPGHFMLADNRVESL